MTETINIISPLLLICIAVLAAATWNSPDSLDIFARRMRARAMAVRCSRASYRLAYDDSICYDLRADAEKQTNIAKAAFDSMTLAALQSMEQSMENQ